MLLVICMGFLMAAVTLIQGDKMDAGKVDYRDALSVNMYAIPKSILGAQGYMQQIQGLTSFGTSSDVSNGGIWCSAQGFEGHYRVQGSDFVSVDSSGVVTVLGSVGGVGQAELWFSFDNLAIVRDGKLYYYNPTAGFRQITDNATIGSVVGAPISGCYVSSIMFLTDGLRIYHCQFDEFAGQPAEEVWLTNAESVPEFVADYTYALRQAENDELIVFGSRSIEHFYLTGVAGFAFSPLNQKASRLGVVGTHSMALSKGNWYLVGRDQESAPSVYAYRSGSYQKVASRDIEKILSAYTDAQLETIVVDSIVQDDIEMIIFHLPDTTLLYNPTIASVVGKNLSWSKLKTDTTGDSPYRAKDFVQDPRINQFVVGDRLDGTIGLFDDTESTHYGDMAEWLLFSPFVAAESLSINKIEIDTISGIVGDVEDATVFLSTTHNGRTYGHEHTMTYGDRYDYSQRFIARALGYVRDWVGFKFRGISRNRMAFGLFDVDAS